MGPEATVLLMSRIIGMTDAHDDADHVPMLVDNNTQVPSRIKALIEKTGEDPGPVLIDMALRLEAAGVDALAMPCNTAHYYAPRIQAAVSIPLLDMIELSADAAATAADFQKSGNPLVGILASPAVRATGMFDRACARRGFQTAYPADQDSLLACIRAVKAKDSGPESRDLLQRAASELHGRGIKVMLIACSELSIISDAIPKDFGSIDTLDVLADAVVRFASAGTITEAAAADMTLAPDF